MNKATILLGKIEGIESYQLLIGQNLFSTSYDSSRPREYFLRGLSEKFVTKLIQTHIPLEVSTMNGARINTKTLRLEEIQRLEDEIVEKLKANIVRSQRLIGHSLSPDSLN